MDYKIIEGNGASIREDSKDSLKFVANGSYSKFAGIKVDNSLVNADCYTAESGSTIITLKNEFLDTLSVGKHTISVLYTDGEAAGEFTITAKPAAAPDTGDTANASVWMGTWIVSTILLAFVLESKRRKIRE